MFITYAGLPTMKNFHIYSGSKVVFHQGAVLDPMCYMQPDRIVSKRTKDLLFIRIFQMLSIIPCYRTSRRQDLDATIAHNRCIFLKVERIKRYVSAVHRIRGKTETPLTTRLTRG